MANFLRRAKPSETPEDGNVFPAGESVLFEHLDPDATGFFGQAAYLYFAQFQAYSKAIQSSSDLRWKVALSAASGAALAKQQSFEQLLEQRGVSITEAMQPFVAIVDDFERRVLGRDLIERVTTSYVTGGILTDFYVDLASRLDDASRVESLAVIERDAEMAAVVELLREEMQRDERVHARVAVWSRRLVADTLLVARDSIINLGPVGVAEAKFDRIFGRAMSSHAGRLRDLGITA